MSERGAAARGFTLIEVLVALAIVAMGMAAVLGALSSSAGTVAYLRDKTFANWVALNQIAQLRLKGQTPSPGKSDGDSELAGRKWHWQQEITSTQVPGMLRIDVSVRPTDVAVSDEDTGWYSTVSGMWGDAVGLPRGDLPDWGTQLLTAGAGTATPGATTAPGTTPGTTPQTPANQTVQPVQNTTPGAR